MSRCDTGFCEIETRGDSAYPDGADRWPEFIGGDTDPATALGRLRVLGIGIGSVGQRIVDHAARLHVAELALVDPKRFSGNVGTQAIRDPSDVGRLKTRVAGRWAKQVSPSTNVRVFDGPVETLPWPVLDRYDVIIASTDLLRAEVAVGQRALWLGKPLIYAAVHGPTLTAQVRVFTNRDGGRPCPACGLAPAEIAQLDAETRFSCDPAGRDEHAGPPTMSVAPLCALAADLAVLEMLRLVLGLGAPVGDALRLYNAYTHETIVTPLERNPRCPCDHTVLERVETEDLGDLTLRRCAAMAGITGDAALMRTSFDVDDATFAWSLACRHCGHARPFNRFIRRGGRFRGRCRGCGRRGLEPHPFFSFSRSIPVQGAGLRPLLDVPLGALGAPGIGVVVRHDERAVLVTGGQSR